MTAPPCSHQVLQGLTQVRSKDSVAPAPHFPTAESGRPPSSKAPLTLTVCLTQLTVVAVSLRAPACQPCPTSEGDVSAVQ